ncbi:insulinase family protein [bacterium]|nr:insulinase family protein [bacterium]
MSLKKSLVKYPFLTKDVEIYERENGHKIVLAHKEGGMVNVSSWVKTGSINESDKNNGISHFLEHLMFKGTHKHKAGEFDKILEAKGAIVNAATWKDYTFYYVTLPKGEGNKDFYQAIELHADMMIDPIVPDYEMGATFDINDKNVKDKKERHVVIEETRMREDQPWTKVYNSANNAMYTSHPYKRDVIGTPQIISQVTQQEIMDYYHTFYCPANITTIVVGDFDHKLILEMLEKAFDFGDRKNIKLPVHKIDEPTNETKYLEDKANINSAFMMFGFLGPIAKDLKNSIMLEMLSIILGDGSSSRLYQNLIEKQKEQIFNVIDADHYQFKDGNNLFIEANFKPEKKEEALSMVKAELKKLCDEKVSEDEFTKAKKKIKSKFAFNAETVSEIGETIGYYMTVCDNLSLVQQYLTVLNDITREDLQDASNRYLSINHAVISVLLPQ